MLVGWIPHWHDMGLIGQLLAFFNGANLVTMSPLAFLKQPIRLLKAISDYRGTITAAPNFAYDLIARRVTPEQLAGLDLSAWEVALNGAEPVRRRTVERITDLLAPAGFAPSAMRPGYGMAEVTLMATVSRGVPRHLDADADALEQNRYTPAEGRAISLVSSGEPAPGIEVRIVDPETLDELAEDQVGEIWLRSASVASGYHNRPAETIERFRPTPPTASGPICAPATSGYSTTNELYVTGRLKDLLIVNGRNLYPQDIEEFVQDVHPAVAGSRGCRDLGRRRRRRTPGPDPGRQDRVARRHELRRTRRRRQERRRARLRGSRPRPWCSSTVPEFTSPPAERCSAHRCGQRS